MQLIGWTLIHSLWEGGVIALLLALAFSAARNSAASVRYALGMLGLALMVALPIATASRMSASTEVPESAVVAPVSVPATYSRSDAVSPSTEVGRAFTVSGEPTATSASAVDTRASILRSLEPTFPFLVAAWLIGLLLLSARMIGGVARTRRLVRDGSQASDRVLRLVSRLSQELGVQRAVRALEGTHVTVPMVIGWLRPVIVVPASLVTGLTPSQLEMLLAHELAHIRRYDFLANMLQTVIETLLFFHPAAWWLSDRIREERENCCDDIAVAASGGDRKAYTTALLALEESRDNGLLFAAAATGGGNGTLLRRALRLMTGGPAHVDLGARWIAGVITILAALFATGPAVGKAADLSIPSRLDVLGFLAADPDSVPRYAKGVLDASQSNPDTVLRYAGNGSFAERWRWAEQRARSFRGNKYWVGYLIAGDPTGRNMFYFDRETPVRSGNGTFTGRMRIGDVGDLIFSGAPLAPLVGNHASTSTAIFLQFDRSGGNDRLTRVHVGAFRFPVYFAGVPAIWIDSATDAESVEKLRGLFASERSLEVKRDLISAVGVHRDANVVLPPLMQWLDSNEPESIRREAVEAIGDIPDRRAVAALARVARNDRSSAVAKEAIEAFEGMRLDAATDTLMGFITTLESSSLRRVAVESLGGRREPRVVAFLTKVALDHSDMRLRRDAIEALGSMHDNEGFEAISAIARRGSDADVRRTAVEELANSEPADRAVTLLKQIIRNDPEESVRLKAVEALSEVHDDRAAAELRALVAGSTDPSIQLKATEALGEGVQSEDDVRALVTLARTHPRSDVRRKAIETLGEIRQTPSSASALIAIVRSDADEEFRLAAIEALGNMPSRSALDALRAVAQTSGPDRLRRQAMETLADNADTDTAVAFLKSIIASDPSSSIRSNALEILSEMDHDAGIPAVRELARSSTDPRVRRQAAEILSEH